MSILITLLLTIGLGLALSQGRDGLIARTPYNNRANDAPGARQDHMN